MALTKEQIKDIKAQLFKQMENWPKEQKEQAIAEIEKMNEVQFEEFLVQNKIIKDSGPNAEENSAQQSPFRLIVEEKIPSVKVAQNSDAIAVLEINPISKGHSIVIPIKKSSQDNIPSSCFDLAKDLGKRLKERLNAKKIDISVSELFGEAIIQVLPVYENENFGSKRQKAETEELEKLREIISEDQSNTNQEKEELKETPKKVKKVRKKTKKQLEAEIKKLPKAPKRLP